MKQVTKSFFSVSELAKILGISRIAVFKKIKNGQIPASKVGRAYVINADQVTDLIGQELSQGERRIIKASVSKVVHEYGETLRLLGRE
ncbi:MAG: excisionase family DNA-binding protein [Patescibacteria group bacterium]